MNSLQQVGVQIYEKIEETLFLRPSPHIIFIKWVGGSHN